MSCLRPALQCEIRNRSRIQNSYSVFGIIPTVHAVWSSLLARQPRQFLSRVWHLFSICLKVSSGPKSVSTQLTWMSMSGRCRCDIGAIYFVEGLPWLDMVSSFNDWHCKFVEALHLMELLFCVSRQPIDNLTPEERDARTVFCMQLAARIRARDLEDFFSAVGKVSSWGIWIKLSTKVQGGKKSLRTSFAYRWGSRWMMWAPRPIDTLRHLGRWFLISLCFNQAQIVPRKLRCKCA